jgi:hypothetical protein
VTIDAMGCQKKIAERIRQQNGGYVLALTGNQERLAEDAVVLRHSALGLLKSDEKTKLGIKNKRLKAGWDESHLANLLFEQPG